MTGTTRRLPAWEPEPLPLPAPPPAPLPAHREVTAPNDEREAEREGPPGSHVVVIDIG